MPIVKKETFSRWLLVGIPLLLGVGVLGAFTLHTGLGLSAASSTRVAGVLVILQCGIYVPMFWVRRQFKRNQDMRPGVLLFGAYCLAMGLALIHYASLFHISPGTQSDYLGFFIYIVVVVGIAVLLFSLGTRKKKSH